MQNRSCPCGAAATNPKGPPRCDPCRRERVRLAQQRYHDKDRGTYQRGWDNPACVWCEKPMETRPYEVLRPKRFCSDRCKSRYGNEKRRAQVDATRRCACGQEASSRRGVAVCSECSEKSKADRSRRITLKPYGITPAEYDAMLAQQGDCCAICGTDSPGRAYFSVDHCHDSSRVRGLLCVKCNSGLGMFQDSPEVMQAAVEYLTRNESKLP